MEIPSKNECSSENLESGVESREMLRGNILALRKMVAQRKQVILIFYMNYMKMCENSECRSLNLWSKPSHTMVW